MQAATAQDFSITTGVRERSATAYVFYPLNIIAPALRATVPDWKHGGILKGDLATLRHRNGYIRQCEITECRQQMIGTAARNVLPTERRHMASAYTLTENGVSRQIGGQEGDDPLLFTAWYPDQELGYALAENDGMVRIPVNNATEARAAQYFLFPDWDLYLTGEKQFPTKLVQIRALIAAREFEAPAGSTMRAVVEAALRACDLVDTYGRAQVNAANAMFQEAQVKGWTFQYGTQAELFMEQLGIIRKDNLAQEQTNKIDRLADVLAEAFSGGWRPSAPLIAQPVPAVESETTIAHTVEHDPKTGVTTVTPDPASTPDMELFVEGAIVRFNDQVGQIIAIGKKDATVETPEGKTFKAPLSQLEIAK